MSKTYKDYIDSRKFCPDFTNQNELADNFINGQGFVYFDGYYWVQLQNDGLFCVLIANKEKTFNNLHDAELWLWNEFVKDEEA